MKGGLSPQTPIPKGFFDDKDPSYFNDELKENITRRTPQELAERQKKRAEQDKIDSARIAVVYEALSRGVELKDNKLYQAMLETYPYYQKLLAKRKRAIANMEHLAKVTKAAAGSVP